MPKRAFIYPYHTGSRSARELSTALDGNRIRRDPTLSKYVAKPNHLLINWGSSDMHFDPRPAKLLNNIDAISLASNKLEAFRILQDEVKVPEFTTDLATAKEWTGAIIARSKLTGHGGSGIVYYEDSSEIPSTNDFKIYTRYVKKTREYRVHVCKQPDGTYQAFRIQVKKLHQIRRTEDNPYAVRNFDNGWVFSTNVDFTSNQWDESVKTESIKAVKALGLEFGAVDVIWNKLKGVFILEVNTAPGLEGETIDAYANQFKKWL